MGGPLAAAPLPLSEPDEGAGTGVATIPPDDGWFAAALYPGAVEMTFDVGGANGPDAFGGAIGVPFGAREITTSPGGTAATGGGAFDATAAGDGVADDVEGDGVSSAPSACGCSPLT